MSKCRGCKTPCGKQKENIDLDMENRQKARMELLRRVNKIRLENTHKVKEQKDD